MGLLYLAIVMFMGQDFPTGDGSRIFYGSDPGQHGGSKTKGLTKASRVDLLGQPEKMMVQRRFALKKKLVLVSRTSSAPSILSTQKFPLNTRT